jgi:hypothetical protein
MKTPNERLTESFIVGNTTRTIEAVDEVRGQIMKIRRAAGAPASPMFFTVTHSLAPAKTAAYRCCLSQHARGPPTYAWARSYRKDPCAEPFCHSTWSPAGRLPLSDRPRHILNPVIKEEES